LDILKLGTSAPFYEFRIKLTKISARKYMFLLYDALNNKFFIVHKLK